MESFTLDGKILEQLLLDPLTKFETGIERYNQPIVHNIQYYLNEALIVFPIVMSPVTRDLEKHLSGIMSERVNINETYDMGTFSPTIISASALIPMQKLFDFNPNGYYSPIMMVFGDTLKQLLKAKSFDKAIISFARHEGYCTVDLVKTDGTIYREKWYTQFLDNAHNIPPVGWFEMFTVNFRLFITSIRNKCYIPDRMFGKIEAEELYNNISNSASQVYIDIGGLAVPMFKDFFKQKPVCIEIWASQSIDYNFDADYLKGESIAKSCCDVCIAMEFNGKLKTYFFYRYILTKGGE